MIEVKRKAVEAKNIDEDNKSTHVFATAQQILGICSSDARGGVVGCKFRGGIPQVGFRWITGATGCHRRSVGVSGVDRSRIEIHGDRVMYARLYVCMYVCMQVGE